MKSNHILKSSYRTGIVENALILVIVTFLLGTMATFSSRFHTTGKGTGALATTSATPLGIGLRQIFIAPYASAWKKISRPVQMALSSFHITYQLKHIPATASSMTVNVELVPTQT